MTPQTSQSDDARRLKDRLRHELKFLRIRLAGHALVMLFGGLGLVTAAAVLTVSAWTQLGEAAAWTVWGVLATCAVWVIALEWIGPLRRLANLKGFSRALEEHGDYGNLLEAATQFSSHRRVDPTVRGASPELVKEIMRRAATLAEASDLAPRIPLIGVAPHTGVALLALITWLVVGVALPERVAWTAQALSTPASLREVAPSGGLYAVTGDERVPVGGEVTLVAHDFIEGDDDVVLEINRSGDFWQQHEVTWQPTPEDPAPYRLAEVELDAIEDPFRYRFRKDTAITRVHRVDVRERPVITDLRMRLVPPEYVARETRELENPGGTVTVLEGTRIDIDGRASSPLDVARRIESVGTREMRVDGEAFSDSFTVTSDTDFRIELVDAEGLPSEALTTYRIIAQADEAPNVRITLPAADLPLERDLKLPIAGLAADDVGLARLDLVYRGDMDTEWERLPLFVDGDSTATAVDVVDLEIDRGTLDVAVNFTWDLGYLDLLPGDGLVYALEATDNNARVGGQVTRSRAWRLRLPTIAEVFELDAEDRATDNDRLDDLLTEGREVREDLERLNRELKKDPDPDWDKKQEIRETLERQQALREQLQDSVGDMQQQLEEFERNNSGSLEIAEKMDTIQDLMESLQDDESLKAYLEAMEEAMEQLLPHEVQRQMEDALTDQQEFNRRLDRTIELLKQLEREREMSDLVEEVNEYLRRQEQLAELTDPRAEDERAAEEPSQESGENEAPQNESQGEESDPGDESESSEENPTAQESESSEENTQSDESQSGEESESSESESSESESGESQESEAQDGESEQSEPEEASLDQEELARMQEKLREETERLEERLEEALERLQEERKENASEENPSTEEMRKALEEALEQMQEGEPSEPMEQAEDELAEGNREEARDAQEEARERLLSLYEVLMEGQSMMQQAQGKWAGEKLQQTAFDLLQLSHREEGLVDGLAESVRGQRTRALTREQGRVVRALEGLNQDLEELARQDFNIPEPLLAEMRNLVELGHDAVDELQRNRGQRSRATAVEVMGGMNEIVIGLLTAAKNAQGGGGGGSQAMPSPSQQMRELAEEQSRLNGMTEQLRERMAQGLSPSERQELSELRAQQEQIRRTLDEIQEQIDDERRVLGDLDDLGDAMERVENDLGLGELSDDLERQQDKILSRLLDAERSIRERDFAKRREARGSQDLFRTQIGESDLPGLDEREDALRRYTAPDRAPEAYRDDVRRYFRSIQRELERGEEGGR